MNTKRYKLLHYTLIILLMFAPLRSVFAAQFIACNMDAVARTGMVVVAASSTSHRRHMMNMSQGMAAETTVAQKTAGQEVDSQKSIVQKSIAQKNIAQVKNCCGDKDACQSDCHVAISASLFIQGVDYSPLLVSIDTINHISSTLLVRELIPPSRPPLVLYS